MSSSSVESRAAGGRSWRPSASVSKTLLAAAVALVALPGGVADAAKRKHHRPQISKLEVQMAINAERVRWTPDPHKRGSGRLTLSGIAPRMSMVSAAPRRRHAVVTAAMLGSNWKHLFRSSGGVTNAIVTERSKGVTRTHAVQVKLIGRSKRGDRLTFQVSRLERTAATTSSFGATPQAIGPGSMIVVPVVTEAIKALWAALLKYFTGETPATPGKPTKGGDTNRTFDGNDGTYPGPDGQSVVSQPNWEAAEQQNFDAAGGGWTGELTEDSPDLTFAGDSYNGLALFGHDFGTVQFDAVDSTPISVKNLAITDSTVRSLDINRAEIAGANFDGTRTNGVNISNSAFAGVHFGTAWWPDAMQPGETRGVVTNTAFMDVEGGLSTTEVDFTSVLFQDAAIGGVQMSSTTFQGCSFSNVDLSNSTIVGSDPSNIEGGRFQPTFDNSIFDGVKLDGSTLTNVSFHGVDFSSGTNSLDGVTLVNVDFTGAIGLQNVDWTKVKVTGYVYGLAEYGQLLQIDDRDNLRTITFDSVPPEVDEQTGYDIEPGTGYLIDPGSGVRLARGGPYGGLEPIDPRSGQAYLDPVTGDLLQLRDGELVNVHDSSRHYTVDYDTGLIDD